MCTSKDSTVDTCFIAVKLNKRCLEPISRNSVFVVFKVSLLAASHTRIFFQIKINAIIYFIISPAKVIIVSSTYVLGWEYWRQLGRSFIFNRKRRSPRIVPCGTPQRKEHFRRFNPVYQTRLGSVSINKNRTIGLIGVQVC